MENNSFYVSVKAVFKCKDKVLYYEGENGLRDLPGGHITTNESIQEALARELREELGFVLKDEPKLIHAWKYDSSDGETHRIYVGYEIVLEECKEFRSIEYPDALTFFWINEQEVKDKKFLPGMEAALLRALHDKKDSAD